MFGKKKPVHKINHNHEVVICYEIYVDGLLKWEGSDKEAYDEAYDTCKELYGESSIEIKTKSC